MVMSPPHKVKYTRFTGDGDTNAFKTVFESTPYPWVDINNGMRWPRTKAYGYQT